MKGLTPKQSQILAFIETYIAQFHHAPSYREIMHHFSLHSPGSVYKHIQTLKRKKALDSEKGCSRSLYLLPDAEKALQAKDGVELPFVGNLMAQHPIEMFLNPQKFSVPSSLVHAADRTYLLQVQGNGFRNVSIEEGDLLLIEARQEAQPGEIVLGLFNGTEAFIKRYFPEGQYLRLESISVEIPPIIVRQENFAIQGILTGLVRSFTP